MTASANLMSRRFRGFLPVVVDVETGGFNADTDALLEVAAVTLTFDSEGILGIDEVIACNVEPFPEANIDPAALEFTGINLHHPFRFAVQEEEALKRIMQPIRQALKQQQCKRAVLVGHNPTFDLKFMQAAIARVDFKRDPFHPFTTFDTATLAGLAYGQTVLAKACQVAKIDFDAKEAHSAKYDAVKTAELFCQIVNTWKQLGGLAPTGL